MKLPIQIGVRVGGSLQKKKKKNKISSARAFCKT